MEFSNIHLFYFKFRNSTRQVDWSSSESWAHQQTAHCESLRKTMIFALANLWRIAAKVHLRILANPCESLRNHELRKHAKGCETLRNHICEFARSLRKHAKSHLRILAKLKYFCECIFAKPCENTCISHLRILAKTRFAKPC